VALETSIRGHVAVIAAGAAGIGLACAERLAAEGAKIAVIDRDAAGARRAADRLTAAGAEAIAIAGECGSSADMDAAVKTVTDKWGRLDILVNCPGGFHETKHMSNTSLDEWRAAIEWNLTSIFSVMKSAMPAMQARKYGRIVNIASLAGRQGIELASVDYSAAKTGVIGLTRRVAVEVAKDGITVNAVAPGTIMTPRIEVLHAHRMDAIAQSIPVGRLGTAEEIADGVWYLARPAAGFMTGAVLDINGGRWTG